MANKAINDLPASGALVSTTLVETQLTGAGASQKGTLAQLLTFIQANATAFTQANVTFSLQVTANVLEALVTLDVGGGKATIDGATGLANFVNGFISFTVGGGALFANSAVVINADGSATFAGGPIALNGNGSASFAGLALTIGVSGDVIGASWTSAGDVEITDTTKGVIIKSPNGTRYRIKVGNTGVLGTELA